MHIPVFAGRMGMFGSIQPAIQMARGGVQGCSYYNSPWIMAQWIAARLEIFLHGNQVMKLRKEEQS